MRRQAQRFATTRYVTLRGATLNYHMQCLADTQTRTTQHYAKYAKLRYAARRCAKLRYAAFRGTAQCYGGYAINTPQRPALRCTARRYAVLRYHTPKCTTQRPATICPV